MDTNTPAPAPVAPAQTQKGQKLVGWAVILGIVIVLNVFFSVAVSFVYNEPVYEDFCPQRTTPVNDEAACVAQEGTWQAYPQKDPTGVVGYCDFYAKCQQPWQDAQNAYRFKAFATLLALGILSIIAGIALRGSAVVSNGLSFGGVVTLIMASVGYWSAADHIVKLAIAGLGLLALLAIGYRLFKD